jgi:hypothetical protein
MVELHVETFKNGTEVSDRNLDKSMTIGVIQMAGIFVHLVIAREILKSLPQGTFIDEGLFYAGSIAPDAIHARDSFIRAEKKHTHLRDDIPDKELGNEENLSLFYHRVTEFIKKNKEKTDGLLDLYRGYVVHILTDELFILSVRKEFSKAMEQLGIEENDKEFYSYILNDMNSCDLLLAKEYKEKEEIKEKLENVKAHYIEDYLSEIEIKKSREWVIQRYFYEEHELLEPLYIRYQSILDFIEMAVPNIIKRLSEDGSIPRMF